MRSVLTDFPLTGKVLEYDVFSISNDLKKSSERKS